MNCIRLKQLFVGALLRNFLKTSKDCPLFHKNANEKVKLHAKPYQEVFDTLRKTPLLSPVGIQLKLEQMEIFTIKDQLIVNVVTNSVKNVLAIYTNCH